VRLPATGAGQGRVRAGVTLTSVCLVLFLTFLDTTIVSAVLADVQSSLHAGVTDLQWVVNGYALPFAALMLPTGALGDRYGRRRVLLGGVAVFVAGSVVAAVAPSVGVLIAGRVIMGVGAAASEPGTLSVLRHVYPEAGRRARAVGIWVAVSGVALACGPVVGGLLSAAGGWRAVFWANLGLGVIALAAAVATVPETSDPEPGRADRLALGLTVVGLAAATFATTEGQLRGFRDPFVVGLYVLAVVAAVVLVLHERRAEHPLIPRAVLELPGFGISLTLVWILYFAVFAVFFFSALYLQAVVGLGGAALAARFVGMAVALVVAALAAGTWVARRGPRQPLVIGSVLAGAGLLVSRHYLTAHAPGLPLALGLTLTGLGLGLAVVPVTTVPLTVVPAARSGLAASVTNTSRELGVVAGVAVLGALLDGRLNSELTRRLTELGVPAPFQAVVRNAVETGAVPSGGTSPAAAEAAYGPLVTRVIDAAYQAFGSGLHVALLVAAVLCFAGAVLGAVARWPQSA
jgi:EmrB/QacA subfamily drug resistance transporter